MQPRAFVCLLLALLLSGCASTRLQSTWRDTTDTAGIPHRLAVFVAVKDDNLRKMAENRAVQSLPPGVGAVAGHRLALSPDLEVDAIRAQLVHGGYDAALVSRLVSVDTSTTVVPTQTHFMTDPGFWGVGPRYRSFYSIYPYAYTTPAYAVEDTRVIVETLLYRLPEGRPVWTAVSETANPRSSLQVVDELIRILGARLSADGLLPPTD